jgi:hypothetical protein
LYVGFEQTTYFINVYNFMFFTYIFNLSLAL